MLHFVKFTDKSSESSYHNLRATKVATVAAMILICFSNTAVVGYSSRPIIKMVQQNKAGIEIVREMPFKSAFVF